MKNSSKYISILLLVGFIACVQATYKRNISIELDMRGVLDIKQVGIRGEYPPLSWNKDLALTDSDGDSVYTGTFVLDIPYDSFQYKFVLNGSIFELQNEDNRVMIFDGKENLTCKAKFDQAKADIL